jgi:hypothetical protein
MKKPFSCIGDVDTLIKLGFSHVPMSWLQHQLPPGLEGVMEALTDKQRREIIIKEQ